MRAPLCMLTCIVLAATPALSQISDGSFEGQTVGVGTLTGGSWTASSVAHAEIRDMTMEESLLPSDGNQYLRVVARNDAVGTPGAYPYDPATVTVVSSQALLIPNHAFIAIAVDWEWLPKEDLTTGNNDFLSIDVVNLTTMSRVNLLYIDVTNSMTGSYTNVPGAGGTGGLNYVGAGSIVHDTGVTGLQSPAGFKRLYQDLTGMVATNDMVTLQITVGNATSNATGDNSVALIDNATLIVAELNTPEASLRVLASSHKDGEGVALDYGSDYLPNPTYEYGTAPGARISLRAGSIDDGIPWALVCGDIEKVGTYYAPVATLNISSFEAVIDGIEPGGGDDIIGTITDNHNYIDTFISTSTPPGTRLGFQAVMLSTSSPFGLAVSAATEVIVGPSSAKRWPSGATSVTPATVGGPNAAAGGVQSANGATRMDLSFLGFGQGSFPFYGTSWGMIWVNSNGSLTFGNNDTGPQESEADMLTDPFGKMAVLWDNLDPSPVGARVRFTATPSVLTISWDDVREAGNSASRNNFAIRLYPSGEFTFYYGSTSMKDGLVGISPGSLLAPLPGMIASQDWSPTGFSWGSRGLIMPGAPRFQYFENTQSVPGLVSDTFDIGTLGTPGSARIHFVPTMAGGYTFFTGTR